MKDKRKTKAQLIDEISGLRRRLAELEKSASPQTEAEQDAQRINRIHSLILNNDIMGIAFVRNRIFEWVNQRFSEMIGRPFEQIHGTGTRLIYASDAEYEEKERAAYTALSRGEWFEFEISIPRSDGKTFAGRIVGKALNPSFPHESSLWIFEDITKRRQAESALKESEAKYHLLVDNSYDLIWTLTADGTFSYVSPSWQRMLCHESSQIIGRSFQSFIHPEDVPICEEYLRKVINAKQPMPGPEYRVRHADGTWRWHTASGAPVYGPDGTFIHFVGISRDATEYKRTEKMLKEGEQRLNDIIQGSPFPSFVIGKDHRVIYWNRALEEYSGIKAEDVVGSDRHWQAFYSHQRPCISDLIVDGEIEKIPRWYSGKYSRSQVTDGAFEATDFFPGMRGGTWLYFTAAPIRNADGVMTGAIETLTDITKRKQYEHALQESRRQLSDIIGFLPDATIVIDKDGKTIAWNRATEIMTGVKAEDMLGKGNYEYAIPFYGDRRPILIDLALRHDPEREKQYTTIQRAGDILFGESYTPKLAPGNVHLSATASVLRNSRGDIVGAIECIRNNTERKQMEDDLRESQQRLADIINFLPDATLVIDRDGKVVAWNKTIEDMTGVRHEDILGRGDYEYALPFYGKRRPILVDMALHPEENIKKDYVSTKWHGDTLVGESYMPNLHGGEFYMLGTASPLYDTKGAIVGAIETIRDITARRKMEEALIAEREKLASILDGTPVPAFVIDREGRVILWNKSNESYTGRTKEDMLGKRIDLSFLHRDENTPSLAELMLTMTDDDIMKVYGRMGVRKSEVLADALELTGSIFLRGEERVISVQSKRIAGANDDIIGVIQTALDITERVNLEKQFRQAHKMQAIGTLAGGIAHDFNNILSAIMGYTELYKMQVSDRPRVYNGMEEVLKAAKRAKALVQQILTFSRQTAQEKKPIMMVPIVKEVAKFLRASLPSTIEIKHSLSVCADIIMADPTQMHQVMMNLCTNAGYAMKETGGVLEIGLKEVLIGKDEKRRFPSLVIGRYLELSVRDTGHGISGDHLERIFEPYYTTKSKGEGTGLGLAVVHGIIRDHGGEIKVYSELGKGTVFQLFLPLAESRTEETNDAAEPVLTGGKERILILDDEEALVNMQTELLEELGYKVLAETDPVKAIEEFTKARDSFDLVITDKTMPHMTGFDVAKYLRNIRADIPIIMCSGFQDKEDIEKQCALGINIFIVKPIAAFTLAESVRNILDKGKPQINKPSIKADKRESKPQLNY